MLLTFPIEKLMNLWKPYNAILRNNKISNVGLLSYIWNDNNHIETNIMLQLYNVIEHFLIENDVNAYTFIKNAFIKYSNGINTSSKKLLYIVNKYFDKYYNTTFDARRIILKDFSKLIRNTSKGAYYREVFYENIDNWNYSIFVINYNVLNPATTPNINSELIPKITMQLLLNRFELPEYEYVNVLTDMRRINEIIPNKCIKIFDNRVYICGKLFGYKISFNIFCENLKINLRSFNKSVIQITENYELNNRILLKRGMIYNAPVILFYLKYSKIESNTFSPIKKLINDTVLNKDNPSSIIQDKHILLVNRIEQTLNINYDNENEVVSINKQYLISGKPAKIFMKILNTYSSTGRLSYERKEFLYDKSITTDRLNPNLSIHFKRLKNVLNKKCPQISINRKQRGLIEFNTSQKISLT